MVIKASAASEIRGLVQALSGKDDVRRESAIARLAVIGGRAVPQILTAYRANSDRAGRLALLRALEPIADPRVARVAREALAEGGDLAVAATAILRELLDTTEGEVAAEALDALMAAALSGNSELRVRLASIDALQHLSEVRPRLAEALASDPDPGIRDRASGVEGTLPLEDAAWKDALDGHLPDDPRVLREALNANGSRAALSALQKLVDRIRAREEQPNGGQRDEWRALRGSVHQALALRGSRVALYDLRETFETTDAELPASFLAAVQLVGDSSCLEGLAAGYSRASTANARWQAQLAAAFRTVAAREHITRRHAVIKRIAGRWPQAAPALIDRVSTAARTAR
jgi:hypothetical protein